MLTRIPVLPSAVWHIRLQALNVKPLTALMVGLGRAKSDDHDAQAYKNSSKLYAQEIAVDSLRHSDVRVPHLHSNSLAYNSPLPCLLSGPLPWYS
jgi:hypothetical protein